MKQTPLLTAALLALPIIPAVAQSTAKPNVILIMCDDLGWADVGFNGNKIIQTPHLDKLAAEGIVMDRFYAAAPVSSPTRASVLTGRHPFRTGVFHANVGILRPEETTIPELLKQQGYTSGHFGKWHLGTLTDQISDANRGGKKHPELLNPPSQHGYDEAFVTESKIPTYDPMIAPFKNNNRFWDYLQSGDSTRIYGTYYWDFKGNKVTDNLAGDNSRVTMDRVLPYIDKAVKNQQPFLSTIWFHTPHLPCVAGPDHSAIYKDYSLEERNYYGCITAMDEQVGRLVNYLKAIGVYDNTLLFFCSDNGPEIGTPGTSNLLKERKRSLYEGGIRVPALAVWPQRIRPNQRTSSPGVTSDYLPTLADILNITVEQKLDGESLMPALTKNAKHRTKPIVFCSDNQAAIIDNNFKLYYKNGVYELYNLAKDEEESNNIASEQPAKLAAMQKLLHQALEDFESSFEGEEYGTQSYKRVKQSWKNVFHTN